MHGYFERRVGIEGESQPLITTEETSSSRAPGSSSEWRPLHHPAMGPGMAAAGQPETDELVFTEDQISEATLDGT